MQLKTVTIRELSSQALQYLASLSEPLPDDITDDFYEQNRSDYNALLTLNKQGLGVSESELLSLMVSPLLDSEVKRVTKRLHKLDELYLQETEKEEKLERDPKYWDDYYSGHESRPTNRYKQLMRGIEERKKRIGNEFLELSSLLTKEQASNSDYCFDGYEDGDFFNPSELNYQGNK